VILGNKCKPQGMEGRGQLMTSCDATSLTRDSLRDQLEDKMRSSHVFILTLRLNKISANTAPKEQQWERG